MKLTLEQVRHVANLARLDLSAAEVETYQRQLSVILEAVEQLAEVDTAGVEPTSHVMPGSAHLRADEVVVASGTKQALSNAPQTSGNSYVIPKVIE